MDYIKIHHLWRPLAAISSKEENHISATILPISDINNNTLHTISMSSILTAITPVTSSISTDQNVWHKIVFRTDANSIFNRLNETLDENLDMLNVTVDQYYNYTNGSNVFNEQTWELVTMVGTAVALGLLILATVIGK